MIVSEPDSGAPQMRGDGDETQPRRLGIGQKLLLVGSIVLMVLGLGLGVAAKMRGPAEPASERVPVAGDAAGELAPMQLGAGGGDAGGGSTGGETPPHALDAWSPTVFRLGFSFFVGFAIAYAVRTFLKISITAIGMMLLLIFGLQYAGVDIDVDWSGVAGQFDSVTGWLREQTSSFTKFVQGALPSSAMAGLGLFTGFRKK